MGGIMPVIQRWFSWLMNGNMSKCLWFRLIIFSNGIIVQRHQTYEKLIFLKRRKNSVLPTCIQFLFVKHKEKHFLKKILQNFMENQSCKLNRIDLKMNLDDKKIKVSKLLHTGTCRLLWLFHGLQQISCTIEEMLQLELCSSY